MSPPRLPAPAVTYAQRACSRMTKAGKTTPIITKGTWSTCAMSTTDASRLRFFHFADVFVADVSVLNHFILTVHGTTATIKSHAFKLYRKARGEKMQMAPRTLQIHSILSPGHTWPLAAFYRVHTKVFSDVSMYLCCSALSTHP